MIDTKNSRWTACTAWDSSSYEVKSFRALLNSWLFTTE